MPVPCVDTIIHRHNQVLLGRRTILPYRNVWALIGGRMRHGETFPDTSIRNCLESGLTVKQPKYLGIFPVKFPKGRHDLTICMTAEYAKGGPQPTHELSKYIWTRKTDLNRIGPIGGNYLKMLKAWQRKRP